MSAINFQPKQKHIYKKYKSKKPKKPTDHLHDWDYSFKNDKWVCSVCNIKTDFFCLMCNKIIKIKNIPQQKSKYVAFHKKCLTITKSSKDPLRNRTENDLIRKDLLL